MTAAELLDRLRGLLDALELPYLVGEDDAHVIVPTEDDLPVFLEVVEVEDSADVTWPVVCLAVPVLEDIDLDTLPPGGAYELNHSLVVGKVALDEDMLVVEHEVVGWPGDDAMRVTIEQVISHVADVRDGLPDGVVGTDPQPYSALESDASS